LFKSKGNYSSAIVRIALVSLVFNIGCGAFGRSTLLRHLNAGDHHAASKQFTAWNRAGGRVVAGLVRRREAEQMLFREEMEEEQT
jgi:lysozyme